MYFICLDSNNDAKRKIWIDDCYLRFYNIEKIHNNFSKIDEKKYILKDYVIPDIVNIIVSYIKYEYYHVECECNGENKHYFNVDDMKRISRFLKSYYQYRHYLRYDDMFIYPDWLLNKNGEYDLNSDIKRSHLMILRGNDEGESISPHDDHNKDEFSDQEEYLSD